MRSLSVNQMKRRMRGKPAAPLQHKPREGSRSRVLYDLLMANPGKPIDLNPLSATDRHVLGRLETEYGLDIRAMRLQGRPEDGAPYVGHYILAGEWFGYVYVDYTCDTEEQMNLLMEACVALQHTERTENILPEGVHILSKKDQETLERLAEKGRKITEKHTKRVS